MVRGKQEKKNVLACMGQLDDEDECHPRVWRMVLSQSGSARTPLGLLVRLRSEADGWSQGTPPRLVPSTNKMFMTSGINCPLGLITGM